MSLSEVRRKMGLRKIDLMHHLFGELSDRKCKDCQHLVSYTANRKYYKCECYGNTHGPGTDWRLKWTACGMIDRNKTEVSPVVSLWRIYNKLETEQIEGQLVLDEFMNVSVPDGMWVRPDRKDVVSVKMKGR